jgi:hypothetical protein
MERVVVDFVDETAHRGHGATSCEIPMLITCTDRRGKQ